MSVGCGISSSQEMTGVTEVLTDDVQELAPLSTSTQDVAEGKESTSEDPIAHIREVYADTQARIGSYEQERIELDGYSTEGAEVLVYRDQGAVRRVDVMYYGEVGKSVYESYFSGGEVVFVYHALSQYNAPIYVTEQDAEALGVPAYDPQQTSVQEQRFYLKDQVVIRWIDAQGVTHEDSSDSAFEAEALNIERHIQQMQSYISFGK